jgi:hypothetical protein
MNQQTAAIIIAGALIAAAIALTNHWDILGNPDGSPLTLVRLDRWTGKVVLCGAAGGFLPGWEIPCPVPFGPVPPSSLAPTPSPSPVPPQSR